MGKRSSFERIERDYYPTPLSATYPLIAHTGPFYFCEPCAGDGRLVKHLEHQGAVCTSSSDILPQADSVQKLDAINLSLKDTNGASHIVTNPPWDRKILHPLITHLSSLAPTWLLFDADWMHTQQSKPFMKFCQTIISIGRVKWIEGSKNTGKDNCCWYLFTNSLCDTTFVGRN